MHVSLRSVRREATLFARVKQLLKHPDFSLRNPNRARSLLSGFCVNNPGAFHRLDAAGYVFWAEHVIELIARVAAKPDLSGGVREIVTNALAL